MADDWQPGDLALAIEANPDPAGNFHIYKGSFYNVMRVLPDAEGEVIDNADEDVFLALEEDPERFSRCWAAESFRKVPPLTEEEKREALRDLEQDAQHVQRILIFGPPIKIPGLGE